MCLFFVIIIILNEVDNIVVVMVFVVGVDEILVIDLFSEDDICLIVEKKGVIVL